MILALSELGGTLARDTLEFMKAAIRRPLDVSTVFPTSRALAGTLLGLSDLDRSKFVVELGPGTGAITKYLAPKLLNPPGYLGIEVDEKMVMFLRSQFPHLRFEIGLAEQLRDLVAPASVDSVVSSLPWTVFSPAVQIRTIEAITLALKPGGTFTTYICANASWYPQARNFLRLLRTNFESVHRSDLEWWNVPPAYVYRSVR
jgi:phospholipid N-methyltransferase